MRHLAAAVMDVAKELAAAALILILARDVGGAGGIALALAGVAAWFALSRWRWPYKPCRKCKATGRNKGSSSRRHGDCRRCRGTRRVRRLGAAVVHRAILAIRNRNKEK